MFNPCYEHCYLKSGKSYDEKCDATCEYAKVAADKKRLTEKPDKIYAFVKKNEDKWYDKLTGKDMTKDIMYTIHASSFQMIRYFIEGLEIEEAENDN